MTGGLGGPNSRQMGAYCRHASRRTYQIFTPAAPGKICPATWIGGYQQFAGGDEQSGTGIGKTLNYIEFADCHRTWGGVSRSQSGYQARGQ